MRGDGNGWVHDQDGSKRWGRYGAAGLLLRAPGVNGEAMVLLQHRAVWSHQGGTWSLPGGARDSEESVVDTALRETFEETGVAAEQVRVRGERETARIEAGWTYTTVVADAARTLPVFANEESEELRWVAEGLVDELPLHPGMAQGWPAMRARPVRLAFLDTDAELAELLAVMANGGRFRTVELPDGSFGWLSTVGDEIRVGEDVSRETALGWLTD